MINLLPPANVMKRLTSAKANDSRLHDALPARPNAGADRGSEFIVARADHEWSEVAAGKFRSGDGRTRWHFIVRTGNTGDGCFKGGASLMAIDATLADALKAHEEAQARRFAY